MRILVVEDDAGIAAGLRTNLQQRGYAVDVCQDIATAWHALSTERFDAVLLDLGLPDGDGSEIVRRLRSLRPKPGQDSLPDPATPVLILTARDQIQERVAGLNLGADDYLVKPFDSRELLARVRANLRRQAPIEELVVLRYGDLVYDTKALLLACGREEIAVSKKLGLMIELFMKSKGQALARATLFARVWGADADVEEAILDNYIGFFRRRLVQIHSKMSLRTVRGVGYALVEEKEGR